MNTDDSNKTPSTQPYLLRALHEWCTDNGFTPYLAVKVDGSVQVPPEFVQNGEIVLNISYSATSNLRLGNDYVEFQARFGGVPREIIIPVNRVMAIYARENGQGMGFAVPDSFVDGTAGAAPEDESGNVVIGHAPQPEQAIEARNRDNVTPLHATAPIAPKRPSEEDEPTPPPAAGGKGRPVLKLVK